MRRWMIIMVLAVAGTVWGQDGTFNPFGASQMGGSAAMRETTDDEIEIAPTTQATTAPTTQISPDLIERIETTESELEKAKAAVREGLQSSGEYKKLAADVAEKKLTLDEARINGTPQAKIDASSVWNQSRMALKRWEQERIEADESVKTLSESLAELKSELAELHKRNQQRFEQVEAKRKAYEELIEQAKFPIVHLDVGDVGVLPGFQVTQVIDESTMLVDIYDDEADVLIKGFSTSRVVDGRNLRSQDARQNFRNPAVHNHIGCDSDGVCCRALCARTMISIRRRITASSHLRRLRIGRGFVAGEIGSWQDWSYPPFFWSRRR